MRPPMEQRDSRAGESNDGRPFAHDDHPSPAPRHHLPPPIIGERDILAVMMLLLMFGANLGMKYYYRSRNDHKKLLELEKQNLEQQLEYLRYQINPHFFMNTLNNIHALVDIDPEKAQATILELSKMMRFVLYEGDKNNVTLSREFDFLRTYIHLMELRYTDKVKISVDLPSEVPDKTLPPLMLISFVENAFKHGVSYRHDSFIEVSATLSSDQMHFTCRNSKADHPNEEKGGVGLSNVKKRLDLLYDNRYTLDISDGASIYNVELTLPLS
jgi:LytS/YehU family sensor histidine kinase